MTLYTHDYEYAFNHYRPDYIGKGEKNTTRYTITGLSKNDNYFRFYADNREDVEYSLNFLMGNGTVNQSSVAVQNRFGQLLWNAETGTSENAPRFMWQIDKNNQCFNPSSWN